MITYYVILNSTKEIEDFVRTCSMIEYPTDLSVGRSTVDAKSIVGVFSLDLSKVLRLDIHTSELTKINARIEQFIANAS